MSHLCFRTFGFLILVGAFFLTGCQAPKIEGLTVTPSNFKALTGFPSPNLDAMTISRDIPYAGTTNPNQTLDIYLPNGKYPAHPAPLPLVVFIHGGGWAEGNKNFPLALALVEKGYVVASLNYRLTGEAIFPAQLDDCKAAIRWLRGNAGNYSIDPNRIGVWGLSAGGHLAALLGTTGDRANGAEGAYTPYSSKVQAVCDWYGPSDFSTPRKNLNGYALEIASKFLGGDFDHLGKEASPVTYVSSQTCPFLIVHGENDHIVPVAQAQELYDKLKAVDVDVSLLIIPGEDHGFRNPQAYQASYDFFRQHL
jgi:acetyl esterase/lipase